MIKIFYICCSYFTTLEYKWNVPRKINLKITNPKLQLELSVNNLKIP